MEKLVIYVGNFFFPDGNAAGKRVYGNILAIEKNKYKTAVFSFRKQLKESYLNREADAYRIHYTIPYSDGLMRLNNKKPFNTFKSLFKEWKINHEIVAVVIYTTMGTVDFNRKLVGLCHENNVKVVYDFCDYFDDISKQNYLKYLIKRRDLRLLDKKVIPNCDGIISISTYLQKKANNSLSIVVPPLTTVDPLIEKNTIMGNKIHFAYATFLSDSARPVSEWKDRIDSIIDIFYCIKKKYDDNSFLLKFFGFSEKDLLQMFMPDIREVYKNKLEYLKDEIVFLGECSNKIVQNEIKNVDFTILLRDKKNSTMAGFPTKISESISLGVPVLANDTSDITSYISDGKNGFILNDPKYLEDNISRVYKVLKMDRKVIERLKESTIMNNPFDYRKYINTFSEFFLQLQGD